MTIGLILLVVAGVLLLFGAGQRVLDRLRLTDRQALFFTFAILIGGLLPEIPIGSVRIGIGGALIPALLAGYVFLRAGSLHERMRCLAAALSSAAAVLAIGKFFPDEPDTMVFDVNYLYGIAAGLLSATLGRSRRAAFVAGVWGVLTADVVQAIANRLSGIQQTLHLGGAGILDAIVISGFGALLLAEAIGEFRERLSRGAEKDPARVFENGEITGRKQR